MYSAEDKAYLDIISNSIHSILSDCQILSHIGDYTTEAINIFMDITDGNEHNLYFSINCANAAAQICAKIEPNKKSFLIHELDLYIKELMLEWNDISIGENVNVSDINVPEITATQVADREIIYVANMLDDHEGVLNVHDTQHIREFIDVIEEIQNDAVNNREWALGARMENSHDTSVSQSYCVGVNKLKKACSIEDLCVQNILSYYIQTYNNATCSINTLSESIKTVRESLKLEHDAEYYKNILTKIDIIIPQLHKLFSIQNGAKYAVAVIDHITPINDYISMLGVNELDVLLLVWARIHDPKNADKKNTMIENLTMELVNRVATFTNDEITSTICVNGRIGAYLSALEINDYEEIISIVSTPLIRATIIQHKVPTIMREWEQLTSDKPDIKTYITNELTQSYKNYFTPDKFKELLDEIISAID